MSILGYTSLFFPIDPVSLFLNANNTASYPGSGTTWTDLTGYKNNGTMGAGVTFAAGPPGSMAFTTTAAVTFSSPINIAVSNFSINTWVKFTTTGVDQFLIDTSSNAATGNGFSLRLTSTNRFRFWAYNALTNAETSATYTTGTWYNVCATYNNTTKAQIIYVNGVQVANTAATGFAVSTLTNLRLGRTVLLAGSFAGSLSLVTFYPTTLNSNQVAQNFGAYRDIYGV